MRTLEIIFKAFQFILLTLAASLIFLFVVSLFVRCGINAEAHRDYEYEAYCDSVWNNDPDYYLDVLCTTDEYQDYIAEHGEWWNK